MNRLCVFCGSSPGTKPGFREATLALAQILNEQDIGLVYGGGDVGLMGILANAVLAGGGEVIGVIPKALATKEVAHWGLTDLRIVADMHERKAMMYELSDGFIALPGGIGTLEEFFEVLTWAQLGMHTKPCGLLNVDGYYDAILEFLDLSVQDGFFRPEHRAMVLGATEPGKMLERLRSYRAPRLEKWIDEKST